jgi:hypothetical protein
MTTAQNAFLSAAQLSIAPTDPSRKYLADATVVHEFIGQFADDVMRAYGAYLAGTAVASVAQSNVEAVIKEYGDAFMGRDPRYEIAPWQGERMKGRMLAAIVGMKYADEPGHAFFKFYGLQCVKASMALAGGAPEERVGKQLKEILDDARGRLLGVIL